MQVNIEETSPVERKLSITLPADTVDAAFSKAYREVGRNARVPGFRPGKIPRGLLDVHYGPQIRSEVESKLVGDTLYRALQEQSVSPIGMPKIETGSLKKGSEFSYTAEVEIQPEIVLQQYKYLVAPKIEAEVADEEINEELEKLRKQATQLVPVLVRDTVETGDVVLMDYEGTMGGVPFEGGKGENALIEIGGEDYLPGFSDGLLGAKVPSERQLPVDFPEEYVAKKLAGKQATFHVKIKEIKTRELPDLDDDFAKDMGEDSLDALRTKLIDAMRAKREQEVGGERRMRMLKGLVEANPFDLPPSMVKAQAERMVASAASRVQAMMGDNIKLSEDELGKLRIDSEDEAEFQVRCGMLLLQIAEKEGHKVDAADLDAEIGKIAEQAGAESARARAHYANPDNRRQLEYRLLEDRTVAFLLDSAVETEAESKKKHAAESKKVAAEPQVKAEAKSPSKKKTSKTTTEKSSSKKTKVKAASPAKKTTEEEDDQEEQKED